MQNIKYVKQPGYIYDIIFVPVLYFNKELICRKFVNKEKGTQDADFYQEILNKFPPFPEELSPFFHMKDDGICLMSSHYWHNGLDHFFNDEDINYLYGVLSDTEELKRTLIEYYLPSNEEEEKPETVFDINHRLLKSKLPDKVKMWVTAILANPEEYSKLLIETLKKVEEFVKEYHKHHNDKIEKLYEGFDIQKVQDALNTLNTKYYFEEKEAMLSVSIIQINVLCFNIIYGKTCFVSGINGMEMLEQDCLNIKKNDISLFGKIISDASRIKILQMLVDKGEMSTGDIAHGLSSALPSTYYHLDMMLGAEMLRSRNQGRTVFYKINEEYFKTASTAVLRLTKEGVQ